MPIINKEYRKIIPFIFTSIKQNTIINLTQDMKDLHKENYKSLKKETEDYR
jgi:hypothetical protein